MKYSGILIAMCILFCGIAYSTAETDVNTVSNESPTYFFVQEGAGGSYSPDEQGNYSLTLTDVRPDTIAISDRPFHDVQFGSNTEFVKSFNWNPIDPPNALLIIQESDTREAVIALELMDPAYNSMNNTLSYTVKILENAEFESDWISDMNMSENQSIPSTFGRAQLIIDDCGCIGTDPDYCSTQCTDSQFVSFDLPCRGNHKCCGTNQCKHS